MTKIKITEVASSNRKNVSLDNVAFGTVFTDHMFVADFADGKWSNFEIKPLARLSMHPGNSALHYGQSIFEGMKASIDHEGHALLLRPEMHAQRLNASAKRMCMPEFPEDIFVEALHELVSLEKDWIPSAVGSALYIRPFMFATDEFIGVRPSLTYKFIIFTMPVGPYYSRPVSLRVETTYVRAADGGVGEAKTSGNYAAALYPTKLAQEAGYDQVMWLDAKEFKYVQEVGTMNIFFVIDNKVYTPSLNGSILKGITRDTIIQVLRGEGYEVVEENISIDTLRQAHTEGKLQEIFGTGTAAVIAMVNKMAIDDYMIELDSSKYKVAPFAKSYIEALRNGTRKDIHGWIVPARSAALV